MSEFKTTIGENKYGKYCLPVLNKQRQEVTRIQENEVHEPDTIEFALKYNSGDIVHGGTFFGDMLPVYAANFNCVWAFEPSDYFHYCAKQTLKLNKIENVVLTNAGIANHDGEAYLSTKDRFGYDAGSAGRITSRSKNAISIRTIKLDSVIPVDSNISVIHLDVEGQELNALAGAMKTITRCRPALILETKNASLAPYNKLLNKLGYSCTGRTHHTPHCPQGVNTTWEVK